MQNKKTSEWDWMSNITIEDIEKSKIRAKEDFKQTVTIPIILPIVTYLLGCLIATLIYPFF